MDRERNSFRVKWDGEYHEFVFAYTAVWDERDKLNKDITYCLCGRTRSVSTRNPKDDPDKFIGQKRALRKLIDMKIQRRTISPKKDIDDGWTVSTEKVKMVHVYSAEFRKLVWSKFFAMWDRDERGNPLAKPK